MTDGLRITIELKEEGELLRLGDIGFFHQHTLGVQLFPQDFRAEPLRDEGHFQIAAVAVVGTGAEIHDAVRIEGRGITLRVQADADRTGNGLGGVVREGSHTVHHGFRQLGGMDIFQIIFDFIAHRGQTSISK